MHWIIQNNLYAEKAWMTLLETVQRFGIPHSEHKVVPFVGDLEPVATPASKNVICMGSYSLRHIAKREKWYPGVFDLMDQDFTVQKQFWGKHLLNYNSVVCRFEDILFDKIAFMRPITDSKTFSGRVFEWEEVKEWQHNVCEMGEDTGATLNADTLVQVSEPLNIYSEYRFWVVRGKISTSSMYKRGKDVIYSPEVDQRFADYVHEVISIWSPHESFVIDVADTEDGLRIVEPNTLNASGYYAADMQKLVFALEEAYTI